MKKRNRVKRIMNFILLLIVIAVISVLAVIARVQGYSKYIYSMDNLPKDCDAIIVLGAGVRPDGTPSDILVDRLQTSVEVFNEGINDKFILSGDHGRDGYNEVRAMKDYVMKNEGVNEKDVFMDHAGFSTYDTMYRAKEIFDVKKAIIVTNEYHLPRSIYVARKLGIEAYGVKSDIRQYQLMDRYTKREKLAQLKDFIYVNIIKPEPEFLGDAIPVSTSDGRVTDDEVKE